jgi:hypothetical protein
MAGLKLEIAQESPFSSLEEEALLNLLRTADCMQRAFHRNARNWGVTSTQYNVLRILRGAQPHGLTCSAIGHRMITARSSSSDSSAILMTGASCGPAYRKPA